jgi:hypothetical protein
MAEKGVVPIGVAGMAAGQDEAAVQDIHLLDHGEGVAAGFDMRARAQVPGIAVVAIVTAPAAAGGEAKRGGQGRNRKAPGRADGIERHHGNSSWFRADGERTGPVLFLDARPARNVHRDWVGKSG